MAIDVLARAYINAVFDSWEIEDELEFRGRWADDGGNLDYDAEPEPRPDSASGAGLVRRPRICAVGGAAS